MTLIAATWADWRLLWVGSQKIPFNNFSFRPRCHFFWEGWGVPIALRPSMCSYFCQAQPKPKPNPQLGAEIALFSQLWGTTLRHHTPYDTIHPTTPYTLRHHTPGIVVLPVFVHAVFFITCSVLVQYFFSTCSQLVHTLFLTCSWLVHDLFTNCSLLVHHLFITCSWLIHDLFKTSL